jgi:hypothetical protein
VPDDFPLKDFLEFRQLYADDLANEALMSVVTRWSEMYPDRKFISEMLAKTSGEQGSAAPEDESDENGSSDPSWQ